MMVDDGWSVVVDMDGCGGCGGWSALYNRLRPA